MEERIQNIPSTGRFGTVVLVGHECAWNPDAEFRNFVINTLQTSGYDLQDFELNKVSYRILFQDNIRILLLPNFERPPEPLLNELT